MNTASNWTGERLETFVQNDSTIEHLHRYALAAELVKGRTVLDIACGEGYGSALLARQAAAVKGMDIDKSTIEQARKRYTASNLSFEQAAVEKIPAPDQQFDVVVSFETLEHTDRHQAMLSEIKRVLKKDGLLMLSTPEKKNYSDKTGFRNPFHKKELYRQELETLIRQYFTNCAVYCQQMTAASVITGAESNAAFQQYTGNFEKTETVTNPEALYLIVLASDQQLPPLPASIFSGASVLENALEQREQLVKRTLSYQLGHILLYPFKKIRQLVRK